MSETIESQEPETLKVTIHDPSKVDLKDFKFKTAKQLDKKMKRAERILSFDDPDSPDEPINVHLRALTSNEEAILHQSRLSQNDVQSLVSVFLEKTEKGQELETSDITDIVAEKLADNNDDDGAVERFYRRLQMAIIKPRGVTIEWLKRRNPNMLDIMNDTIDELQIENDLWLLQTEMEEVKAEARHHDDSGKVGAEVSDTSAPTSSVTSASEQEE